MNKEKYVITRVCNRKPISLDKFKPNLNQDGIFVNCQEHIISQIVEAKENKEFEIICSQIQNFIEKENIDTCFVINKSELIDCLKEHQMLKLQITDTEAKLAESEETIKSNSHNKWLKAEAERYKSEYQSLKGYIDQLKQQLADALKDFNDIQEENDKLAQQLAEKDERIALLERSNISLNDKNVELDKYITNLQKHLEESKHQCICAIMGKELLELEQNQTAIAELEKVKEYNSKLVYSSSLIDKFINQQIKSLKGEK